MNQGRPGESYEVMCQNSKPAELEYYVRLAICQTEEETSRRCNGYAKKGLPVSSDRYGVLLELPKKTIDNREYWVLAGPFASNENARKFRDKEGFSAEALVVEKVLKKASGTLVCAGKEFRDALRIVSQQNGPTAITLCNVLVGIEFHWQHFEDQNPSGTLEIAVNNEGKLAAIDEASVEDYVASVNSSEMTVDCPPELLRTQTVAARSTVFATMGKHHSSELFHLCADDHCQCYHGSGAVQPRSRQAAQDTYGEVLLYNGQICDARYAKICGGVAEDYANVWDDRSVPYLGPFIDGKEKINYPIDNEQKARAFIESRPDVYCNTSMYPIPESLGDSSELFRWEVAYERKQLQELLARKTGEDIGELIDLLPVQRGTSGRLIYLDIVGSKKTLRVGKELEIRRVLSESHLYSSCFYIEREVGQNDEITGFVLRGAGWGHGVGLCQVGATAMASLGFNYREILAHYYRDTELRGVY